MSIKPEVTLPWAGKPQITANYSKNTSDVASKIQARSAVRPDFWPRGLQQEEKAKASAVMILLLSTNLAWCGTNVRAEY